jgi:hypothetical protein
VDEAAAHELGKIIAQNRGRAGHAALLEPGPDIGHAEIGSALIQRQQTLVTEQALYIGSFAGSHGNRFLGGFPVARGRRSAAYSFWTELMKMRD